MTVIQFPSRNDWRARQRQTKPLRHPLLALPFVADLPVAGRPRQKWRCFWHVEATGNYRVDLQTGADLAVRYLDFRECMPPPLGWIVKDMREVGGIEIGFLRLVGLAANPAIARRIRDDDSRAMAALAAEIGEPQAP